MTLKWTFEILAFMISFVIPVKRVRPIRGSALVHIILHVNIHINTH